MKQVAAQLYSLRGHTEDEKQIASALKRVRVMGYEAVQVSGLGPIEDNELKTILDGEGLQCCATHEPAVQLLAEPEAAVEHLERLGCKYTAYPYPAEIDLGDEAVVSKWISRLNNAGKVFHDAGKVFCYHNHHMEFRRLDGKLILDRIYDETDPRYVLGEIDTYWVQYGGADPVVWCRKLAGRLPLLHLKDYMIDGENKPQYTDIGAGNLDWPAIVSVAESSGCEWFIIERDPAPGDPFDSLQASYNYLKREIAETA